MYCAYITRLVKQLHVLRSTFLSYPPTFLTCKRIVSSCLVAKVEVVDGPKSYQVDILCVHYPSHQTVTCGYKVLFSLIPLLPYFSEISTILAPCHHRSSWSNPNPIRLDVLCVEYPSHQTVTCGYGVLFSPIPLLSILSRELYHIVSLRK
jgi:hypothetical protein